MVLLAGATGQLGFLIAQRLRRNGERVRALVREGSDPERVSALEGLGIETVSGDLRDRASLAEACRGVEAVVSTASALERDDGTLEDVDLCGHLDLVSAAEDAGAQRFVHLSLSPPQLGLEFPLLVVKRAVEDRLRAGRVEHTVLQPGPLIEYWLSERMHVDHVARTATTVNGNGRAGLVSARDVARAVVKAVRHPGAKDRTLTIAGPETVSLAEAVSSYVAALGHPFEVRELDPGPLLAAYEAATDPKESTFLAMRIGMATGWPAGNSATAVLGLDDEAWTTVADHARRIV